MRLRSRRLWHRPSEARGAWRCASAGAESVAGAESAVLAACDAATSCSPVTFCPARTTGRRTGLPRSSEASAVTIVVVARPRSRILPDRPGATTTDSPCRRRLASTAGRSTAAAIRATVYRTTDGYTAACGATSVPKIRVCTRFRPRTGANPSPAAAADRTAAAQSGRTPSCDAVSANVRPPATNSTGFRPSTADRRSSFLVAAETSSPPTPSPATVVPAGSRVGDPAKRTEARIANRASRPTARTALRAAMRLERRRRAILWTLVAPEDTTPKCSRAAAPVLTRKGDSAPLGSPFRRRTARLHPTR